MIFYKIYSTVQKVGGEIFFLKKGCIKLIKSDS